MWLNCGLPGWTGPAWVWLAWLAWLPRCLACRVDWPGLGLAGLDRLSSSLAGLLGGPTAVLGPLGHRGAQRLISPDFANAAATRSSAIPLWRPGSKEAGKEAGRLIQRTAGPPLAHVLQLPGLPLPTFSK